MNATAVAAVKELMLAALIADLEEIKARGGADPESDHGDADELLLAYIDSTRVAELYDEITMWYA